MTARTGMADLILETRSLCEAGTADYSLGTVTYWTDNQLQDIADRHVTKYDDELMLMVPTRKSGGYAYTDYYIGKRWIEQEAGGTTLFKVMNSAGSAIGTALYSVDYNQGKVTFATDQASVITYTVTCAAYDLYAVAAEVWQKKAAHYASAYDFSTDNHSVKRSQLTVQARTQANYYLGLSNNGASNIPLERADDPDW